MSESIIKALMRLFAIIESVKVESVDSGHLIIEPFLKNQLNDELVHQYISLFQEQVVEYKNSAANLSEHSSNQSKNLTSVTEICQQLNQELLLHERIIVFIQLVELINADEKLSSEENEFMLLVARSFNIPKNEIKDICSLILDKKHKRITKENVLVLNNKMREWPKGLAWMIEETPVDRFGKHIYIENLFGQITVLFLQSVKTFVFRYDGPLRLSIEGNTVTAKKSYILKLGAIIKGDTVRPIYKSEISKKFLADNDESKLVLQGNEIEFNFKKSNKGIKSFSFYEESGRLIGIMGGSGTGKSTLMNLLNGKLKPKSGSVQINGLDIKQCVEQGVIGYVPQDDLLFEELTVYENLRYNAKLCFDGFSDDEIKNEVDKILNDLDIFEIKDLVVGSPLKKTISGGQRKRLNIALEMLRQPSVLFVDEPTSGLSSMDSELVMNLLKEQTQKGKLVIVIIHQPSSEIYKLLDKLWILDQGGYPIYNGNPIDAIVYFKTMNTEVNAAESECRTCGNVIAEHVLHIIENKKIDEQGKYTKERKTSPQEWFRLYKENIEPTIKKISTNRSLPSYNFKIPNRLQQSSIYLKRLLNSKKRDTQYILLNILEAPILALILSYLTKYSTGDEYVFAENKNFPVYLFMSVVVALFIGLTISAEEIYRDRKILNRESFLNLSRFSYINAKLIYLFGVSGLQTLAFVLIGNYILEIEGMFFSFWLILFSTAFFGNIIGLNISSALNSIVTIYILIPLILVPQLLLGGAMIKFDELKYSLGHEKYVPLIGNLMTSRWAYEALAVEQFKNNTYEKQFYEFDKTISESNFKLSYVVPKVKNHLNESENLWKSSENKNDAALHLNIVENELKKIGIQSEGWNLVEFKALFGQAMNLGNYKEIKNVIDSTKQRLLKTKKEALKNRDSVYNKWIVEKDEKYFLTVKKNNHNAALKKLLTKSDQIKKYSYGEAEIIQIKDPIFKTPESIYGNAQFYAPVKKVGSVAIDTFYFNIIIIWLMILLFYLTLWHDSLRKGIVALVHEYNRQKDTYNKW